MTSRHYSSYLLRFWLVENTSGDGTDNSLVLQIQNLQTGTTWRLNSLSELNELLSKAVINNQPYALPGGTGKEEIQS